MKKYSKFISCILLVILLLTPTLAFANTENTNDWQDLKLSDEEFNNIIASNPMPSFRTSGLIVSYNIALSKSGSTLIIVGQTTGINEIVKCGFTKVSIQKRASSNSSWSNYATYDDLYSNSNSYRLSKSISVSSGYQYRISCTHYAKKNLLSTQKIDNISNIVSL